MVHSFHHVTGNAEPMISRKSMQKDLIIENMSSHVTAHRETLWDNSILILKIDLVVWQMAKSVVQLLAVYLNVHLLTMLLSEIIVGNNKLNTLTRLNSKISQSFRCRLILLMSLRIVACPN